MSKEVFDDGKIYHEDENSSGKLKRAKTQLIKRCNDSGIEYVEKENYKGDKRLFIGIPNGREKRWIPFFSLESYDKLLKNNFEKYVFLGEYVTIASYQDDFIEAMVQCVNSVSSRFIMSRLLEGQFHDFDGIDKDEIIIEIKSKDNADVTMSLGFASETIMSFMRGPWARGNRLSLRINGIPINQHDRGVNILEKLSNSLFFQIDMAMGVCLSLVKQHKINRLKRPKFNNKNNLYELLYPNTEFDEAPISLYWYARSANGMPLLQFLAFYQVIEFYFFSYSQQEARRKIRHILKDPTFRLDRDSDLARLLASIDPRVGGYGNERSQLKATLNSCLTADGLRTFLTEDDARMDFFTKKQKGLSDYKIPINNAELDLRDSVADLIYDIRCKIVHTKGDSKEDGSDLLLPFSKEAELLYWDIELIQYIAQQVLINASSPLTL